MSQNAETMTVMEATAATFAIQTSIGASQKERKRQHRKTSKEASKNSKAAVAETIPTNVKPASEAAPVQGKVIRLTTISEAEAKLADQKYSRSRSASSSDARRPPVWAVGDRRVAVQSAPALPDATCSPNAPYLDAAGAALLPSRDRSISSENSKKSIAKNGASSESSSFKILLSRKSPDSTLASNPFAALDVAEPNNLGSAGSPIGGAQAKESRWKRKTATPSNPATGSQTANKCFASAISSSSQKAPVQDASSSPVSTITPAAAPHNPESEVNKLQVVLEVSSAADFPTLPLASPITSWRSSTSIGSHATSVQLPSSTQWPSRDDSPVKLRFSLQKFTQSAKQEKTSHIVEQPIDNIYNMAQSHRKFILTGPQMRGHVGKESVRKISKRAPKAASSMANKHFDGILTSLGTRFQKT
ncbi:hypothetical protein K469DRAFT_756502 [Zopfia rhizophila CBS 207.26]|uniref:Uncharacterized protein n=1 Tax=Zopfia rhizophila CBS 207.26 TaxID=1314779 RepID=A0A6A6D694_9PEZI|nr:hypothetical protein K469DRAFT_756502 [Zopfia rhizophila CBS 207.26]